MVAPSSGRHRILHRLRRQERDAIRGQLASVVHELNSLNAELDEQRCLLANNGRDQQDADVSIVTLQSEHAYEQALQAEVERLTARRDVLLDEIAQLRSALAAAEQQLAAIEKLMERAQREQEAVERQREAELHDTAALHSFRRQQHRLHG